MIHDGGNWKTSVNYQPWTGDHYFKTILEYLVSEMYTPVYESGVQGYSFCFVSPKHRLLVLIREEGFLSVPTINVMSNENQNHSAENFVFTTIKSQRHVFVIKD